MEEEIGKLKSVLRSLVVSSPTQVDVRSLLRDYRNMIGTKMPLRKYGYNNPVVFLKERFSDCFLFSGATSNPVLTLIAPETLKHIDKFVQKQKSSSTGKFNPKRRSVPEELVNTDRDKNVYTTNTKKQILSQPIELSKESDDTPTDSTNAEDEDNLDEESAEQCSKTLHNDTSGKYTSSSGGSVKTQQLGRLKREIMELITDAPDGVWCTDLLKLYKERYNRELNFNRFGYASILSLVYCLERHVLITRPDDKGDWMLQERRRGPPAAALDRSAVDSDDALPGIHFDPDVFPEDCMQFMESIESTSVSHLGRGAMFKVMIGQVYSPSHFWFLRLGVDFDAMEDMLDEMTQYYRNEGQNRVLAPGAVRVGHYCAAEYKDDWYRSLIVKIIDSDTVEVLHIDDGHVDTLAVSALKPLKREWAALPAQACRARLSGVRPSAVMCRTRFAAMGPSAAVWRPSAAAWRWPYLTTIAFHHRVAYRRFVAIVVAVDGRDNVAEVQLITKQDECISRELIRDRHADALHVRSSSDVSASASELQGRAARRRARRRR